MIKLLLSLFIVTSSLIAEEAIPSPTPEDTGTVSSTHAEYDGNVLLLKGQVLLNHGLGKMKAQNASLQKQETGKDFPFSYIHLEKEVFLDLKDNAKVSCDRADLDFISLTGKLFSDDAGKVTYSDLLTNDASIELKGKEVDIEMSKLIEAEKKNAFQIETVTVNKAVTIHYTQDFLLEAEHAHFVKTQTNNSREFGGTITASPKDENSFCTLSHFGDQVNAKSIHLDLVEDKLSLTQPNGTLSSSLVPHADNTDVRFNSESLLWDHPNNTLRLTKDIHIEDSSIGVIDAAETLQLVQGKEEQKSVIKAIYAQGKTRLEHQDKEQANPHILICHGTIDLQRDKLNARLTSPEIDGIVSEDKQIYYQETRVASFANDAVVDYAIVGSTFQPVSLNLTGNIRLFSHDPKLPKRCSLADRLTYSPSTRTLILYANPGKRVLFWDEKEGLRIAAQEIHITFDPDTKKESINGIGNVKFAFTSEESTLLNQIFPFFKKSL